MNLGLWLFNIIFTLAGWISAVITIKTAEDWFGLDQNTIVILIVLSSLVYAVLQINWFAQYKKKKHIHSTKEKVNKYLLDWLRKGGSTVIFTHDLTWADESSDIREILESKSRKNELTICLFRKTSTTDNLERLGAHVYEHQTIQSPQQLQSRFIIIDYGTANPKINVGLKDESGKFINEQYDYKNNPNTCRAFIELFELVRSFNQQKTP